MHPFTPMVEILKPSEAGCARLSTFTVSKEASLRSGFRSHEYVPEGDYMRLQVNGELVMSDTRMEQRSNLEVVAQAKGHVLIFGLGMGMIIVPILANPEVETVTVVELCADVVNLVHPHLIYLPGFAKLTVEVGDAFKFKPPRRDYSCIYFDIWHDINTDNLQDIATLHRRAARWKAPGAWCSSWMHSELLLRRRREQRQGWWR